MLASIKTVQFPESLSSFTLEDIPKGWQVKRIA